MRPAERQRSLCKSCGRRFDDVTNTIFAGHHQPLRVWMLGLYFMGLNRSNAQMAPELDLNTDDVHQMTCQLRQGLVSKKPIPTLKARWHVTRCTSSLVIRDKPEAVAQRGGKGAAEGSRASAGRGTRATEKPPVFGMIQRGGEVIIRMLATSNT